MAYTLGQKAMTTQVLTLAAVALLCGILTWAFGVLVIAGGNSAAPEMRMTEQEIADLFSREEQKGTVVAVRTLSETRVMPFHRILPQLQIRPHRIAASIGIVGCLLVIGSLVWCLFVPKYGEGRLITRGEEPWLKEGFRGTIVIQGQDIESQTIKPELDDQMPNKSWDATGDNVPR
jgi:hypothetical protein